jgi:SnoaL-like domain
MNDFIQILTLLAGFGLNADLRDWDAVRRDFSERVTVDYSSLTGSPASTLPSSELVASWRGLLPGFTRTQHTIGMPRIEVRGDQAVAQAPFVAWHFLETTPTPAGGTSWVVGGRYEWGLRREANGWRITRLTLHGAWQDGNRELPALVSRRVGDERK